jgi:hypothetical protein
MRQILFEPMSEGGVATPILLHNWNIAECRQRNLKSRNVKSRPCFVLHLKQRNGQDNVAVAMLKGSSGTVQQIGNDSTTALADELRRNGHKGIGSGIVRSMEQVRPFYSLVVWICRPGYYAAAD